MIEQLNIHRLKKIRCENAGESDEPTLMNSEFEKHIQIHFGGNYGINIHIQVGQGTIVVIRNSAIL